MKNLPKNAVKMRSCRKVLCGSTKMKLYAKDFCFNYIEHYFQNFSPEPGALRVDKDNTLEVKGSWENEIYEMTNMLHRDQEVNSL